MHQIIETLKNINTDYQPIPFWSWNDKLDSQELKRQIHWMHENGIGGFFMHARGGLKTPYLSEEWMKLTEDCCNEAEKLGMNAWAYDENGWPSGFCGGKLLENKDNRDMYITCEYGPFHPDADVSYLITDTSLIRIKADRKAKQPCLNLFLHISASTVDILNPDVVDQFLNSTHEQYKQYFGNQFSEKIKGFFTDEPQYYRQKTPYSKMLETHFRETYNEDIFEKLGLLFVEKEGYQEFRYRYWLSMQKLMLKNFAEKVYLWCDENHIQLTGHYVEEVTMAKQLMCCAGVMPFYEYEHIPGIDWLGRETDSELAPKQLGSVAAQLGKKQTLTETFGCCGWDVSPTELQRIAGFQYVNGVNLMCHHLLPYSEHGQRKRDYPAHFNAINPWVKEHFKDFNDYFSKLGFLLSESEEPVNVAILHPIRSVYFNYKRENEIDGFPVCYLDEDLQEACRMFSSRGIAYHFLDETLLETHGYINGTSIACGKCEYKYLVLPKLLTMGAHTEKLLQQYVSNGGNILLLAEKPTHLEGIPYEYPYLSSNCTLKEILQAQPFTINDSQTDLYYTYRKYNGKPFIFVQNASTTSSYTQEFSFFNTVESFVSLDLANLKINKLPLRVTVPENGALLLFPCKESAPASKKQEEYQLRFENAKVDFDTNFLTLDTVCYSTDGITYSEPLLRNKLFKKLLEDRYEGKIWIRYEFEIETLPKKLTLLAEKNTSASFFVNGSPFLFEKSYDDEPSLWMGDISSYVNNGWNYYETVINWHQSEETYYALFGENVTESLRNCIAYDSEIEDVYLVGKFGVYSHKPYIPHDKETVLGGKFYIGEAPKYISEPTTEGFPFFRGKLHLEQTVHLNTVNTLLNVKGRYLTAKVWINEHYAGELLYEHQIDISTLAKQGENKIHVEFLIGNRNLLGPFHFGAPEVFVDPNCFESTDLEDYKLYLFYTKES